MFTHPFIRQREKILEEMRSEGIAFSLQRRKKVEDR